MLESSFQSYGSTKYRRSIKVFIMVRKLTDKQIKKIKQLRKIKSNTIKDLSKMFNVSTSTIIYHTNQKYHDSSKKRALKWSKEHYKNRSNDPKWREYNSTYIKRRYNNDPKFRKKFLENIRRYQKKKKEEWLKQGLCSNCGRELDGKYKNCARCRKIRREIARKRNTSKVIYKA